MTNISQTEDDDPQLTDEMLHKAAIEKVTQ